MDAHLFRLFCQTSAPYLSGARVEKISEPTENLLVLSLYNLGAKRSFYFYFDKKEPFCFAHAERTASGAAPSAQVMRLRRYFGQKRIAATVAQVWSRKLWLLAANATEDGRAVWLCLDLARGFSLHFLSPEEAPEEETARWPAADLSEAMEDWRSWPVLTPALRRALKLMDKADQAALLIDLEVGGGDAFLALTPDGRIKAVAAWPIPGEDRVEASPDVLDCLGRAGMELVVGKLAEKTRRRQIQPLIARQKQLDKILAKLDRDAERLKTMGARAGDAARLKDNLWRWAPDYKADVLLLEDGGERIILDPRLTVRQNMERWFQGARRSKRGLEFIEERRARIEEEKAALTATDAPQSPENGAPAKKTEAVASLARILPKNIQGFRSSDGYLILRGKDARGNLALRKYASGHDFWLHVENGPGAHVVVRRANPDEEIPRLTIEEAAALAANKSWLAEASSASVSVAELRHIKPVRKGPTGKVTIDKIRFVVLVKPDAELETRLAAG